MHFLFQALSTSEGTVHSNMPGNPVLAIEFSNHAGNINFNEAQLDGILNREEIRDRKVVVVSIVGPFRKGKSFLLDYFLRFLYFTVSQPNLNWNFP